MQHYSPSIGDLIIATLCSARSTRQFYAIIREREFKRYKKESVRVGLSRLHAKGYLARSPSGWSVTQIGRRSFKNRSLLSYMRSPFSKNTHDSMIIAYDIPEENRILRKWLRNQIKIFGYRMLQQSLWIGPGPLPTSFLKRLVDLKIRKNVKTFNIARKK